MDAKNPPSQGPSVLGRGECEAGRYTGDIGVAAPFPRERSVAPTIGATLARKACLEASRDLF